MEHHETQPLKWPDGWMRTRIQDRKSQSQWKRPQKFYLEALWKELERLGVTTTILSSNGQDTRDPGVAVYFSRKKEDYSWQDALGLQGIVPTLDQIDSAYRQKALQYHPDRPGGDVKMFAALTEHRDRAKDWVLGKHRTDHDHVIACDVFAEVRLNIAAIKMTLQALRTIERCGASSVLDRVMEKSFARQLITERSTEAAAR